jgi:hypothetical protein
MRMIRKYAYWRVGCCIERVGGRELIIQSPAEAGLGGYGKLRWYTVKVVDYKDLVSLFSFW